MRLQGFRPDVVSWTLALVSAALAAGAVTGSAEAAPARSAPPRVTFIGDSVADSIQLSSSARAVLGRGVRLDLELEACRRLVEPSCTVGGVRPATTLELVRAKGRALGPVVVVAVGYNDPALLYARDLEEVVSALEQAGVQHVLWLTLRAVHHPYLLMNDDVEQAVARHPELTVVDWNKYSRSHPAWFASDGLHLNSTGATAMATLVRKTLASLGIGTSGTG